MSVSTYPKFSWGSFSYSEARLSHDDYMDSLGFCLSEIANMGCDIHWHSETKKDGVWVCDQAASFKINPPEYDGQGEYPEMDKLPGRTRDYWFFGLLNNGVRTNWPWSFPYTCDIPYDTSSEVRAIVQHWDEDGHSQGVRTQAELIAKLEELNLARAQLLIAPSEDASIHNVDHLIARLEETLATLGATDTPDDRRIVFWFGN